MKKIFIIILSFFMFVGYCNADVTTYDRYRLDKYGVNKDWIIDETNKENVFNTHAVDASEKIYDFSNILTDDDEVYLKGLVDAYYKKTGFDLVILTESFYNLSDEDNGNYAQDFYDYNDFGLDDESYSGVVILRNTYEGYNYYGVYSFGEALFYYPPLQEHHRLNRTLDRVYDDMITSNYRIAMEKIIEDLTTFYDEGHEEGMEDYFLNDKIQLTLKYRPPLLIAFIASSIITWIIVSTNVKKNKTVYKERYASQYLDRQSINYTKKQDILYDTRTTSYVVSTSSSGGSSRSGGFSSSRGSSGSSRGGGGRRG